MRELLPFMPRPSHYACVEEGCCDKSNQIISLHVALAFPDAYEVGMSYLGQKILYAIVNSHPGWWAERVMAPDPEASQIIRERGAMLCTLESDTPLNQLDAVCFSITHEMCFTDVLHMLDLGGIPLRSEKRADSDPLVIAGGGAMFGAEPLAPFIDLAALGDGEEILPEILELLERARKAGLDRAQILAQAAAIPGVYVPSLFAASERGYVTPLRDGYRPKRRIVTDLNRAPYPVSQVMPADAVHERLALEIARGCTRGCRFCHAGMIYRPVRERSVDELVSLLDACLTRTGFEEASFLSLSAGDYSALRELALRSHARCAREQVTLALPSLRAGSLDEEIFGIMASLRRTGMTVAPEAGSQRLRNVINKGITEEEILAHVQQLAAHGWKQVKLYFMIGLPTETDEDLREIHELACKVRDCAGRGKLQVTVALSTFVPKPFTPFQWEAQLTPSETRRRIELLRELFKGKKALRLRWHDPDISFIEGVMARGDRKLADVIEKAYARGAIFSAWAERFELAPWLEAFAECGIDPHMYLGERRRGEPLPWSHLEAGVSEEFLLRERKRAYEAALTPDCRFGACASCGACDRGKTVSLLVGSPGEKIGHRLVNARRDQAGPELAAHVEAPSLPSRPALARQLKERVASNRIWHTKTGSLAYLSQLELQAVLERAIRRSGLPVAFSQGYHPLPLVSFGRALPVGVESAAEWVALTFARRIAASEIIAALNSVLRPELAIWHAETSDPGHKNEQSICEKFSLNFARDSLLQQAACDFADFSELAVALSEKKTKNGVKVVDFRPFLRGWKICATPQGSSLEFVADWTAGYVSPLLLARVILGKLFRQGESFSLRKQSQIFANGREVRPPG